MKLYLAEKGLPFKVVLFMDCAGGHATDMHYDGVQVEFLPPNTTSLIQPMDQGVIRAFKALYMRSTMENLISSINEQDETFTMKKYWKDYNIATCLGNIQNALKAMKEQTLTASWKKLWPNLVNLDYEGFTPEEVHHSAVDKAVKLARLVSTEGFLDMTAEDVNALIDAHESPLTDEDLEEMTRSASEEEVEAGSEEDEDIEERGLTLHNMQEMFNVAKELKKSAQEFDDNMVRAVEFCNRVDEVMATYKGIFVQKKKQRSQLPITMFLTRRQPQETQERPPAATTPPPAATTPPAAATTPSPSVSTPPPLDVTPLPPATTPSSSASTLPPLDVTPLPPANTPPPASTSPPSAPNTPPSAASAASSAASSEEP